MKQRRFKIGLVSIHIVSSWGKDFGKKVKESLPENTMMIMQKDNFNTATLEIMIYNEAFEDIGVGVELPRVKLEIEYNDAKSASKIQLLRH